MLLAARSLTLPPGFLPSSLAKTRTPAGMRTSSTSGVRPICPSRAWLRTLPASSRPVAAVALIPSSPSDPPKKAKRPIAPSDGPEGRGDRLSQDGARAHGPTAPATTGAGDPCLHTGQSGTDSPECQVPGGPGPRRYPPVVSTRVALALIAVGAHACGGGETGQPPAQMDPRPFALGFPDFPPARSLEAIEAALGVIRADADLIVMHFEDGGPWEQAAAGSPYPAPYQADLDRRARSQPPGHVRYLAPTPISFERDRLAPRRGGGGSEPLHPPWDAYGFYDPAVVAAFTAHCERMIATFSPDYVAYGIEVNMLRTLAPEKWPAFVHLAAQVYPRLKAAHPTLPVFLTFQVDFLHESPEVQPAAIREGLPFTDLVAASSYPYLG